MQRGKKKQQKEPFSNKENSSRGPAGFEAENCDKDKKKRGTTLVLVVPTARAKLWLWIMILRDKKQTNAKPICVFLAAITDAPIIVSKH